MLIDHELPHLADALVDRFRESLATAVKGRRRADRMMITICVILNAINDSPDVPQGLKDAFQCMISGKNIIDAEPSDLARRVNALADSTRDTMKMPSPDNPDLQDMWQFAVNLGDGIMLAILHHLKLLRWDDSQPLNKIVAIGLLQTLLALDQDEEDQLRFGGACEAMRDSLNKMSEVLPLAA